jgi:tetratricopeptide (TPR) repeat protein
VIRRLAPLLAVIAAASCLAYTSGASAGTTKRLVALAGTAVVLAVSLTSGAGRVAGTNPAWLCGAGFVAWTALSAAWGAVGASSKLAIPLAALGLASVSASLGVERARRIAGFIALGVAAALALSVFATWAGGGRAFSLHAGQGNPNWAGLMLAVALPLAVSAPLPRGSERIRTAVRLGVGMMLSGAILITGSRTGMLSAFAGLTIVALGRVRNRRWRVWALAGLVTLASALAFGTNATSGAEAARNAEHALRGRLWIHELTLRAASEHLPWGAGLGRFHEAFLAEQGRALAELSPAEAARRFQNATSAHQDFLEIALESGPVALVLFVCALILAFRQHFRLGFHAGAGSIAAFAMAALSDSPFRETPAPILIALVIAALPATSSLELPAHRACAFRAGLLASAGLLLPQAVGAFAASLAQSDALEAAPARRLELLRHACSLDPTNAALALELGAARLELGHTDAAVHDLQRAERLDPEVASAVALGNALLARDALSDAGAAYQRAIALNSGSFRARVGMAETLRRQGRFADAERHVSVAVALLPGDARARELLDRIREQRSDSILGLPATPREQ